MMSPYEEEIVSFLVAADEDEKWPPGRDQQVCVLTLLPQL